ncbi:M56 family metallopeptidase [Actinomadura bangladeshensis]|uniref:M56 family peptidase n=1 Tax=Actinomadura bangladeshensis TaxID=453573 RepID=A0A4R4NYU1_9ACTN|nr:M56 family metallopeptidase [Actinomadura bangladeshensis]TDC15091.1 M56 family peptidase [Actinomadura bangladeshensis]
MIYLVISLVATAVLLGCLAGPALDRLRRPAANPGTAIACWLAALAGTFIAGIGIVAVALLMPPAPGHGFVGWLRDCLPHHGDEAVIMAAAASLVLLTACCSRLARSLPRLSRAVRHRRRHWEMLRLVAEEHGRHDDVLVLDHPIPVAYSLPARERAIVVTTGTQETLTPEEFGAVLVHERTHLRQRHHAMLLVLDLAYTLLPWLPTVRRAKETLPLLLEMAADDTAARAFGRRTLANALCRLAATPGVAGALGAAGPSAALTERVLRLESAEVAKRRRAVRAAASAFVTIAVAAPLLVAAATIVQLTEIC